MVDAPVLGTGVVGRAGSNPVTSTNNKRRKKVVSLGLDNGFRISGVRNSDDIPSFVVCDDGTVYANGEVEIELVYWRKCWGLRAAVLSTLHATKDEYEVPVDVEDIPAIIRAITPFFSKEYWDEEGESIWTFEEKFPYLIQDVINLKWLESYMKDHPEVKCYFYDSY